jgi:predicted nucleic acid-binding protein
MKSILIDTNILFYFYDYRDKKRQGQASRILNELIKLKTGVLSVQSLAEFVNSATRGSTPLISKDEILQQVNYLINTYDIVPLTEKIILEAARGTRDFRLSYFDAQIWATAKLNQIPVIFSEDFQEGQFLEGVGFINPFTEKFNLDLWV